ncbi:hypothetical protein HDV62DRAFT_261891 [Trichoderma sp. SZMC 28011]
MDPRYPRQDFSQLATLASLSSNVKRAESGSLLTSKPHKARGITEVSNRNTISRDSTQSNELCALALRNRNTISKDSTQSDRPFKLGMRNRGSTSKDTIENGKARITGAIPPNASPGLYAAHQLSPAQQQQIQQQQHLQQFYTNSPSAKMTSAEMMAMRQLQGLQQQQQQAMFAQQFQNMGDSNRANELPMGMQLTPQQLHQLRQRNAAVGSGHVAAYNSQATMMAQQLALQQQAAQQQQQQQQQQQAAMRRT